MINVLRHCREESKKTINRLQFRCEDRYNSVYNTDANAPGSLAIQLETKQLIMFR
jgi:hypothetical protein